jgi:hypothetical protein
MYDTVWIGPRREAAGLSGNGATGGEPQRQLIGRMQVEGAPQRPCFHEGAVAPERVADVLLRDAIDPCGQLQLGRGLHLGMDAAGLANDVDQAPGGRA